MARIARIAGESVAAERGFIPPSRFGLDGIGTLHTFARAPPAKPSPASDCSPSKILVADNDPAPLKAVPFNELGRAVGEGGSAPSFQAAIWTTPALASYDPDFLRVVFESNPREAPFDFSGYRSASFDSLADRIATTRDPGGRREAVNEALRLLANDVPAVPLLFATAPTPHPSVYDGWRFVKGSGILDKRSFVDPRAAAPPAPTQTGNPGSCGRRTPVAGLGGRRSSGRRRSHWPCRPRSSLTRRRRLVSGFRLCSTPSLRGGTK